MAEYGIVIGRFLAAAGEQETDGTLDGVPLSGTVSFTPEVSAVLVGGVSPATVPPATVVATLDADGYLFHDETRDVRLLAPAEGVTNPSGWTYRVTPQLRHGTQYVTYPAFSIQVVAGQTLDLAKAAPVPSSDGVAITRGEPGRGIESITDADADGVATITYTDGTTAPLQLPAGSGTGGGSVSVVEIEPGVYDITGSSVTVLEPGVIQIGA